jgi:aldehyde dehydrogenase (NAD+)
LPQYYIYLNIRYCREDALAIQNGVAQGFHAIMTNNLREAELFYLFVVGSDCGIANVNIGTGSRNRWCFWRRKETVAEENQDLMLESLYEDAKPIRSITQQVCHSQIKFDL